MAVVSSGYFGEYFNHYQGLYNSREWNAKSYDLATVKNKGDINESLTNESVGSSSGTGLFVKTNKNGTVDSNGRLFTDLINPFYQIRDNQDAVDYNYYVDQETGNVYFRPTERTAAIAVGGVNVKGISLPNNADLKTYTPQYFGTSFNLDYVPNPEEWGSGQTSNLAYLFDKFATLSGGALSGTEPPAYSDIEVNGVKISSNGLNTSSMTAIPTNITGISQDAPLYQFSDAFTTGASDFTSVLPPSRWQSVGAQRSWAGATTPPAGFIASDAMWYPDTTDTDFSGAAAPSAVGVTSALFRTKLDLASIPGTSINVSVGSDSGSIEFFVNGIKQTIAAGGIVTIPATDFKIGRNIIGIHAVDAAATNEGVYVKMATNDVQALGYDISSTTSSWETSLGYPTTGQTSLITANLNEANRLFGDNWTYVPPTVVPPTTPAEEGAYTTTSFCIVENASGTPDNIIKQSYFNTRPVDNFIMKTDMSLVAAMPAGSNSTYAWSGVRIRANKPDDLPAQSGYTVRWNATGQLELYKAYAQNHTPLAPLPIDGDPNVVATVASGVNLSTAASHNLEVHANGSNIKVYIDGVLKINYNDNQDSYYQEGYSGFVSNGNYTAYKNFQLYSYAQPIQLLSRALQKGENTIVVKGFAEDGTGKALIGRAAVSGTIANGKIFKGAVANIDLSTNNIPPNLAGVVTKNIVDNTYKASINEYASGTYVNALDPRKAYWSASSVSIDGIAGKIQFKAREGGDLQKMKDQFMGQNNMMSNLTGLLGAEDDLFNSHLNIIK